MAIKYSIFYDSGKKRKEKKISLPDDASEVKCNKRASGYPDGRYVRVHYRSKDRKKDKMIPVPEDAKHIMINPVLDSPIRLSTMR